MCLHSISKIPFVAKENITCFKVVVRRSKPGDSLPEYYTPYQEVLFEGRENNMFTAQCSHNPPYIHYDSPNMQYIIGDGYVHTYRDYQEARTVWRNIDIVFFECIIPKDTEYFKGLDDNYLHSYASKKIQIIKEIKI